MYIIIIINNIIIIIIITWQDIQPEAKEQYKQNYVCRDKTFVATNITKDVFCRDKGTLVSTEVCLSRQTFFFFFVATKDVF